MTATRIDRAILSDAERIRLLDQLDQADGLAVGRRKSPRLEYRLAGVPVTIEHSGGGRARVFAPTRNISTGGIGLLVTCFLHRGTRVVVTLPGVSGKPRACAGTVAYCRFLGGRIHEIGVSFIERVNVEEFCGPEARVASDDTPKPPEEPKPLSGVVVVVCPREAERVLTVSRLRQCGLDAAGVDSVGGAIDRVRRLGASAVVCDMKLSGDDLSALVMSLGELSAALPVVGLVYPAQPEGVKDAIQSGMAACLEGPLSRGHVYETMQRVLSASSGYVPTGESLQRRPDDAQSVDMVRYYLGLIKEAVRQINQAIEAGDAPTLRKHCEQFSATAPGYGFRAVGLAAREALAALNGSASIEESKPRLRTLLNVCDRLVADSERPAPASEPAPAPGATADAVADGNASGAAPAKPDEAAGDKHG